MTLLELEDVTAFYGPVQVLDGVSLSVPDNGAVGILGANGAGKTTTLRAISGTVRAGGRIVFDGKDIRGLRPDQVAALGIAHVPEGRGTLGDLTVRENLRVGAYLRKDRKGVDQDIDYCLDLFPNLQDRIRSNASALSGGEQQMLAVARAIMSKPRLLLLDEASLGLAPSTAKNVYDAIRRLRVESGIAMVVVEQNANLAFTLVDTRDGPGDRTERAHRHVRRAQGHGRDPSRLPGRLTMGELRPTRRRRPVDRLGLRRDRPRDRARQPGDRPDQLRAGRHGRALRLRRVVADDAAACRSSSPSCVSILFSFVLGAVVERWLMRRFERGDPDTAVVVTIGLLTLITGICGWLWTYNNQQFPSLFSARHGRRSWASRSASARSGPRS